MTIKFSEMDETFALSDGDAIVVVTDVEGTPGNAILYGSNFRVEIRKFPVISLSSELGEVIADCELSNTFSLTLTENTTLLVENFNTEGFATEIDIQITQDSTGGWTFTLPENFFALGGSDTAVAAAPNAVTILSAKTFDGGTTWRYVMQESA